MIGSSTMKNEARREGGDTIGGYEDVLERVEYEEIEGRHNTRGKNDEIR
jgi:hypothetical protein